MFSLFFSCTPDATPNYSETPYLIIYCIGALYLTQTLMAFEKNIEIEKKIRA